MITISVPLGLSINSLLTKAMITLRWVGTSNGYYSESVSFVELPKDKEE
jgi:hypothetical protein